jgi:DNA-binding NtrC family response regulator
MNRVLVVDDDGGMRAALEARFLRHGWRVETATGATEALEKFRREPHPLIVTDIRMPGEDGFFVMRTARALAPHTGVILLTAFASVPDAVAAMRDGACDYLVKPVAFEQLEQAAARILEQARRQAEAGKNLAGQDPAWLRALARARQAAATDADVLIEAESGTGKELVARLIHRLSPRRDRAFVAVNCAAFPETLLESELFGHTKGAFTGAGHAKPGKFELADGGTLLLDEVGEMPLGLQPKLLRVLQEREFDRLGDTRSIRVDLRVIATTNRPLGHMVREGSFRADLYYRLNVIPLNLPPLRERRSDIRELAEHFLRLYAPPGKTVHLSPAFLEQLEGHRWPGNVRELANCVRRAVVLAPGTEIGGGEFENRPLFPETGFPETGFPETGFPETGFAETGFAEARFAETNGFLSAPCLPDSSPSHLPRPLHPAGAWAGSAAGAEQIFPEKKFSEQVSPEDVRLRPGVSLGEMERKLVEITLAATGGNRSRAAELLGVSLRTVRNKVRCYGLPSWSSYGHEDAKSNPAQPEEVQP